ncbi:MAG TPA: sodium-dependent transporter [Gammaproteobacteria bacterium]|nr:sodium-dependent transporter [Gammaproteobacteria bacterium]
MSEQRESVHGLWSTRWAFILAATGSAVGLGNIWKFPYITGENGGGAFVLVYLVCVAVIGIPIMMVEVLMGRRGRSTPINTMRHLCREASAHPAWQAIGWAGMLAGFLILSYYSVIAGWALSFVLDSVGGTFSGATAEQVSEHFNGLLGSPGTLLFWHTLFMLMTMVVVARGVERGLEQAVRFLMPSLFVLLIIMVGYAMSMGEFVRGAEFLFKPDFSKLTGNGFLIAMGHAFFTLSLGMGAIMIYGAYLPRNASIAKTSIIIALADTLVALMAGLAIFPIVFSNGLEPGAGPGLIFVTLPIAFGQMPGGLIFGTLFFILLTFAAWSSAISLIEPAVTWLVENKRIQRLHACIIAGTITWLVGIGTVLSFNVISEAKLFGKTFFDLLDYLTANIMLPLGGLAMAIFVGWVMYRRSVYGELEMKDGVAFNVWLFLVKFVTPVGVVVVFLNAIGVI